MNRKYKNPPMEKNLPCPRRRKMEVQWMRKMNKAEVRDGSRSHTFQGLTDFREKNLKLFLF